ncbi:VWA domain-containing protein [Tunturiibacter gelidoferens]|uniref:VWFA-related protein n=3 Tax=Tunturiibacter TaxID=3154218 RepID=A0A7Y9T4N9_9BACT|nr:VWA domain-containing protein [Edaphobacter lichenicola]MBB5341310.1 VWFA-related protein [Edaphobacter lichenicola]NYF53681.1 VWFA-related protein [Edaphobacter lichenicola]
MRSPCLAAVALALSLTPALHAQEAPSPGGPPPASDAAAQPVDIGDTQTLKVQVNLVNVYFSVRDKSGFITNLHKDDCSILEDKAPQKTKNFTQEKNLPLTIGILLDTSGSQRNVLPLEQQSGAEFLKDVLTPKDEAFLISFDINVNLLADYTNSPREIKRSIDSAEINTGAGTGSVTGNGTARGTLLFDAVYLAAHDKLRQEAGRKILVLLTDGGDQGSQETLKTATEAAQKANAIVYVILLSDRGFYGGGFGINLADTGERDMQKLATDTGGRVINVGNNGKKLQEAFDQIQDELRTQYLASFTPTNAKIDGTFRTLNITCQPGQKIQARKGYYALADAQGKDD